MKKIKFLTLAMMVLLGAGSISAQVDNTFSFIDANGNEVKDGSTITFYAVEEPLIPEMPELGTELKADFDLTVKNNTNAVAAVAAEITTIKKSSGDVQFCFPNQCQSGELPMFYRSDCKDILAGGKEPLASEWFPEKGVYGDAQFTLQLLVVNRVDNQNFTIKARGPKVTINCIYADPAGIADMESDRNAKVVSRYDANGNKLSAPAKGLNIVKMSNGETRKVIVK